MLSDVCPRETSESVALCCEDPSQRCRCSSPVSQQSAKGTTQLLHPGGTCAPEPADKPGQRAAACTRTCHTQVHDTKNNQSKEEVNFAPPPRPPRKPHNTVAANNRKRSQRTEGAEALQLTEAGVLCEATEHSSQHGGEGGETRTACSRVDRVGRARRGLWIEVKRCVVSSSCFSLQPRDQRQELSAVLKHHHHQQPRPYPPTALSPLSLPAFSSVIGCPALKRRGAER